MTRTYGANWWTGTGSGSGGAGVRVPAARAGDAAVRLLTRRGVPASDAAVTARHLLDGDLRGHPAHGLSRLRQITAMLDRGTLDPRPARVLRHPRPAVAVVDGGGGLGPPAAAEAVTAVRELSADTGVAVAAIHRAGHLGTLAGWVEAAASDDCFALMASSSEPGVVAPGGATPLFGTNPLAYSWPSADGQVTADFTTAALTRSELLSRAETGRRLPRNSAVRSDGTPTRDPVEALGGGLLPMAAGHKGVLLSLLVGFLAGPVVGGPPAHRVAGTRDAGRPAGKCDFLLVIRLDAAGTPEEFCGSGDDFLAFAEKEGGFVRPGRGSRERRARGEAEGIVLDGPTARLLWPDGLDAPDGLHGLDAPDGLHGLDGPDGLDDRDGPEDREAPATPRDLYGREA
ncbi:Ldh family oxidoreductase [Streptomyces sp. CA-111067]|uniref:Ldh family oxidoreductase n=1 Tax=Streptomyces sp. CA-111067 TaxID=3240046 RepID=UPI003D97D6AD